MKEKSRGVEDCYSIFIENTAINEVSLSDHIEYLFSKKAVEFKNWWFDNYFGIPLKKRTWKTKLIFILGQFIIHKVFRKYSFSKYKIIKEDK